MKHTATTKRTRAPKIPNFKPLLTKEQVFEAEAKHNETWGVNRRLTMITLSRTRDELIEGFASIATNNGDAFIELIEQITDYQEYLKTSIKFTECAIARLLAVGQYISEGETA
mgnify:CR=1 FL=1